MNFTLFQGDELDISEVGGIKHYNKQIPNWLTLIIHHTQVLNEIIVLTESKE